MIVYLIFIIKNMNSEINTNHVNVNHDIGNK